MPLKVTKFGVEALGKPISSIVPDPFSNTLLSLLVDNNWRGQFKISSSWRTDVSPSKQRLSEERIGQFSRPIRIFSALISGMNQEEASRILFNSVSRGTSPLPVPIYSDVTVVVPGSTGFFISCDPTYRLFFPGQRIAVVPPDFSRILDITGEFFQCQVAVIDYITPIGLVLTNPLATAAENGSLIFPLADCQIVESTEALALTDGVVEIEQATREVSGPSSLPATSDTDIHYLVPYYHNLPILPMNYNWREEVIVSVLRGGTWEDLGNGVVVSPDGDRPYFLYKGTLEEYDRESVWNLLRIFDSRRGRLLPFYSVCPLNLFSVVSIESTTEIRIRAWNYFLQLDGFVTTIAVIQSNGTLSLHAVDHIELGTEEYHTIVLDASEPLSSTSIDIQTLTIAEISRFEQDTIDMIWYSNGVCSIDLSIRSLLNEGTFGLQ